MPPPQTLCYVRYMPLFNLLLIYSKAFLSCVFYYIQLKGFQTDIQSPSLPALSSFFHLTLFYEDLFLDKQLALASSGIHTDPTTATPPLRTGVL